MAEQVHTNGRWPQWVQNGLAILAVITSVYTAYFTLDKKIALLELKVDFIIQQLQRHP